MIIRDAKPDDVAELVAIVLQNYRDVFVPLLPDCDWKRFTIAHMQERLRLRLPLIRVVQDGPLLGFTCVEDGHIAMIFVIPTQHGRKIGSTLLHDCEENGAVSLECFSKNISALRFYKRHGWVEARHYTRDFAGHPCDFVRLVKSASSRPKL